MLPDVGSASINVRKTKKQKTKWNTRNAPLALLETSSWWAIQIFSPRFLESRLARKKLLGMELYEPHGDPQPS